jgi:hypothetical protein
MRAIFLRHFSDRFLFHLMSQEGQKFPLLSIPTVFCESHQLDLHRSHWARQGRFLEDPHPSRIA